ncbi:hypothetical protein [Bdellovibrio sp.]|uniref:hypothetical protein n=1 Tax=Bdellovibrio sp. TaxID=28201 RepID=UPI003221FFAF
MEPNTPCILMSIIKQGPRILRFTVVGKVICLQHHFDRNTKWQYMTGVIESASNGHHIKFASMPDKIVGADSIIYQGAWIRAELNLETGFGQMENDRFWLLDAKPA